MLYYVVLQIAPIWLLGMTETLPSSFESPFCQHSLLRHIHRINAWVLSNSILFQSISLGCLQVSWAKRLMLLHFTNPFLTTSSAPVTISINPNFFALQFVLFHSLQVGLYFQFFSLLITVSKCFVFFFTCSFLLGDQQHASAQDDVNVALGVVNVKTTVRIADNIHRHSKQKSAVY